MAELQKLKLDKSPAAIGGKVMETVAAHPATQAVSSAVSSAVTATVKPEKHQGMKALLLVIVIAAGILSGWGIDRVTTSRKTQSGGSTRGGVSTVGLKVGDIVGVEEGSGEFNDVAEGVLEAGGFEGEGSHKLLRPGGVSQTVYLTSSIVNLDELVGHKIKVWGETFAGQKAGWLMDVGRVQVLELNAPTPEGY